MNKSVLFFIAMTCGISAYADTVAVPKQVFNELQKFSDHGQALSANFVQEFPVRLNDLILQKEKTFFSNLKGQCQDSISVTFGPSVLATGGIEKTFESELIRIEASKCYDDAEPEQLLQVSNSVEFKRRVFSTLRQITVDDNHLYCESTEAPTIGKSNYCYLDLEIEKSSSVSSRVNFLTYNNNAQQFDAPVYFRESLQSSRRMGSKTLFYTLSYVRATSLSSIQKYFAKNYISKSQGKFFTELEKAINKNKDQKN